MTLSNDDVLKMEEASEITINKCLTYLMYIKDKQNARE